MNSMIRKISKITGLISLLILIIPSFLFLFGVYPLDQVKKYMFIATIVWFISSILWLRDKK